MNYREFASLTEALSFIADHGGAARDVENVPGHRRPESALGNAHSYVQLEDGSYFGVESYDHGPLSDVTPDKDFGVLLMGWTS